MRNLMIGCFLIGSLFSIATKAQTSDRVHEPFPAEANPNGVIVQVTWPESNDSILVTVTNADSYSHRIQLPNKAHLANTTNLPESCNQAQAISLISRKVNLTPQSCITYQLRIDEFDPPAWRGRTSVAHQDSVWQLNTYDWLIRTSAPTTVELILPNGYSVTSPWPLQTMGDNHYRLSITEAPSNESGHLIIGHFLGGREFLGAMEIDFAYLGHEKDFGKIHLWIQKNIEQLQTTIGANPSYRIQVIAIPTAPIPSGEPVPFGHVVRAGTQTVRFYVNPAATSQELMSDWTAAHEFSHLLQPYLGDNGRWVSEGFASYYQNVLMAKLGAYDERTAWKNLLAGFQRGMDVRPKVSPNQSPKAGMRSARMMIYWSGAAIALMADVEIRKMTNNKQSLNSVFAELANCCLPANRSWSTIEMFTKLDTFLPQPVFMPLYSQWADRTGFPDVAPTLAEIGVIYKNTIFNSNLNFIETSHTDIRRAIMSADVN